MDRNPWIGVRLRTLLINVHVHVSTGECYIHYHTARIIHCFVEFIYLNIYFVLGLFHTTSALEVRHVFPVNSWNTSILDQLKTRLVGTQMFGRSLRYLWVLVNWHSWLDKETQLHWCSTDSCLSVPSQAEKRVTSEWDQIFELYPSSYGRKPEGKTRQNWSTRYVWAQPNAMIPCVQEYLFRCGMQDMSTMM